MFDIGFGQLLLVLILGLVVLGPKRLPVAIKTVSGWIRALRAISASVQLELSKELKLQELQDSLKQAEESGLKDITPEIQASIDDLKRVTASIQKNFQEDIQRPIKSSLGSDNTTTLVDHGKTVSQSSQSPENEKND